MNDGVAAGDGTGQGTDARRRFDALLRRASTDGSTAGFAYEALRRRLIMFFRLHLPAEAEALADTALDRLARRLDEGVAVVDLSRYALGIARLVQFEAESRHAREDVAHADPTLAPAGPGEPGNDDDAHTALAALRHCLDRLGEDGAGLIVAYYQADGAYRIRARRELALKLDIALNALRNRALRLRAALEDCVRRRLGDREP